MPLHGKQLLKIGALFRNPAVLFMKFMIISSTFWYPLLFIFRKIFMAFTRYITILTLFFFFVFWKILIFCIFFSLFVFLFYEKILILFTSLFSKPFFAFLRISSSHFYIYQKNIWFIFHTLKTTRNHFNHLNQQPS